jgi:hypothetical protein
MSEDPSSDLDGSSGPERPRTDVVLWGLAIFAGCRAIQIFLEAQAMASAVGQAVLVEWGSSRLGVTWTARPSELDGAVTAGRIARRAATGAAVGLGLAGAVVGVLAVSGGAILSGVSQVEASVLVLGLLTAGLIAWRDELLLHGITLRALDATGAGSVVRVLACGATSAGAALGRSDATARTVVVAALLGVVFGALWSRDRGAWQPWAANTTLRFVTGTLVAGGIAQSRLADNAWAGSSAGMLGGTAAVVAVAPLALLALAWVLRTASPQSPRVG